MSYGLYDADLPFYPIPFYNLELMKLSSYYKHKREIVGLSPNYSPQRYNHFIVRQDFYNPYTQFSTAQNVEFGGRAIDGETYKPLPLDIEMMKPDISLYSRAIPNQKQFKNPHAYSTMRRAEHIRLSLDGKTIWKDFEKQLRHDSNVYGMIFHDYDLNQIENAAETIKDLLPEVIRYTSGRRIGMKYPVQVDNNTDLIKWLSFLPMNTYFSLHHNGLIDESCIPELLEIKTQSGVLHQVTVDISNSFTADKLINGGMQRILRNTINLRSHTIAFPLIYNENLLVDDDWKKVMKLIVRYNQHLIDPDHKFYRVIEPYETLYSYCKGKLKSTGTTEPMFTVDSMREIFQFVRENNYDLFKDFYEYRGGEVRDDR